MLHTGKSTTFLAIDDASNDVCHMVADQMTAKKIPKQINASKSIQKRYLDYKNGQKEQINRDHSHKKRRKGAKNRAVEKQNL